MRQIEQEAAAVVGDLYDEARTSVDRSIVYRTDAGLA